MDVTTHLVFNINIGRHKPENIINQTAKCPFCDRKNLDGILEKRGSIWLVKNKYPVLEQAFQTVLIETDQCDSELSLYSKDHLYAVIRFGLEKWLEMSASSQFASVIFYKNHGPCSGGTIRHPHMQIVGLEGLNYYDNIRSEHFVGRLIARRQRVEFNLSSQPRMGFFEFNIRLSDMANLEIMADYIQIAAHYTLNAFHNACKSYNLFFYNFENTIIAKVVPRFITSPLFVGYSIPQIANEERALEMIRQIQEDYL